MLQDVYGILFPNQVDNRLAKIPTICTRDITTLTFFFNCFFFFFLQVVGMQAEVDEAVRETDRLRAENAALEESLCEVCMYSSSSGGQPPRCPPPRTASKPLVRLAYGTLTTVLVLLSGTQL